MASKKLLLSVAKPLQLCCTKSADDADGILWSDSDERQRCLLDATLNGRLIRRSVFARVV